MNYIPNQNEKVLEETLSDFNSDNIKTTSRCPRCFKMTVLLLQVLQKSHPIPLSLYYMQ